MIAIILRLITREGNYIGCSESDYGNRDVCFFTADGKYIRPSDEKELLWAITDWGVPIEKGEWTVDYSEYEQQQIVACKEWEDFTRSLSLNQREIVDVTDQQLELLITYCENWYSYCTDKYGNKHSEYESDNPVVPLGHRELLNKIQCSYVSPASNRKVFYTFYFKTTVDFDVNQTFKVICDGVIVILKYDGSFTIVDIGDYNYYDAIELPLIVSLRNNLSVVNFVPDKKSDLPLSLVAQYPQFSGLYE